jgi:hypothetical protein
MMAGCRGLAQIEELTIWMPPGVRKAFGVPRRLADTTLRDALCKLSVDSLRKALHRAVRLARRRKALPIHTLPFHMVAMDGKATAMPHWDDKHCQRHQTEHSLPYGLIRTVTSSLVTTPSRPCIEISPIAVATNEMGHFQQAFDELCKAHRSLFRMVSYDAGANSEANAQFVVDHKKHYLFRLNNERHHMQQEIAELLETKEVCCERIDTRNNHKQVVRTLRMFPVNHTGVVPQPCKVTIWSHTRVLLRTDMQTIENGEVTARQTRYYVSSLPADELTPKQWLDAIVLHWGVETTHQILDTAFVEDKRPWINGDSNGALVVMVLRRIAYTLLSLWRSISLRSDENRTRPWWQILNWGRIAITTPLSPSAAYS